MAVGTIKQYQGPFEEGYQLNLQGHCIIGISISEDDYMILGANQKSFQFTINGQQIWLGRTYMYQTEEQINNTIITFPDGAPDSTLIEVTYCSQS